MKTNYTGTTVTRILNISKTEVTEHTRQVLENAFSEYRDNSWNEHIVNVGNAWDDSAALGAAIIEHYGDDPTLSARIESEIEDLFNAGEKHKCSYIRFVNE